MGDIQTKRCENCGRTSESIQVQPVTMSKHMAFLCLACTHVFTLPKNKNRFIELVRSKNMQQSNKEMQKVHQLLSTFIAVGMLLVVAVVTAGIIQYYDLTILAVQEIQKLL